MNVFSVAEWLGLLLPALALFFVPRLSPRGYYFGLTVPPDFRQSPMAHAIENQFRFFVAGAFAAGAVLTATFPQALLAAILFIFVAGAGAFFHARHRVAPFALHVPAHTPSLAAPTPLPRWTLLALPPFAILAGIAAYLQAHWNEIPARFPVHWGAHGQPNRWGERTVHGVYGPLGFGGVMMLFMIVIGIATWYGSRPSPVRDATLKILVAVMYMLAVVFGMVGLLPLNLFPAWTLVLPAFLFVPVVAIYATSLSNDPSVQAEPTPDSCWRMSSIYYNPADPAILVQKRVGLGYTFNFGNPFSWVILGVLLALVPIGILMLK